MKHVFRFLGERENGAWSLRETERHHLVKVLQINPGTEFEITDAQGWSASAIVRERTKKDLVFEVESERFEEKEIDSIDLFCAALKPGVLDDVLPGIVELGVHNVKIFAQDRGEFKKITEKVQDRWLRILDEAVKQSKRNYGVKISVFADFKAAWSDGEAHYLHKIMLDETTQQKQATSLKGRIALLIGSEAGISSETRNIATDAGFVPIRIAKPILRARTAVIGGVAIIGQMLL